MPVTCMVMVRVDGHRTPRYAVLGVDADLPRARSAIGTSQVRGSARWEQDASRDYAIARSLDRRWASTHNFPGWNTLFHGDEGSVSGNDHPGSTNLRHESVCG